MRYLKFFNEQKIYDDNKETLSRLFPLVSYTLDNNKVWINDTNYVIATYKNVINIGTFNYSDGNYFYQTQGMEGYDSKPEFIEYEELIRVNEDGSAVYKIKLSDSFLEYDFSHVFSAAYNTYGAYEYNLIGLDLRYVTKPIKNLNISCTKIKNLFIPKNVVSTYNTDSINYDGTYYCYDFRGNAYLENFVIEEDSQLTSIGDGAFEGCISLNSIMIPETITCISKNAFYGCYMTTDSIINNTSLNTEANNYWGATLVNEITEDGLIINNNNEIIACHLDATSVTIPSYVTLIGQYAFSGCTSLTSITFEEGSQLTSINYGTFYSLKSLQSIKIPSNVTLIDNDAFKFCDNLQSVTFEEGSQLISIGYAAFRYCKSLQSIDLPSTLKTIYDEAFSYCSSLTSITFEEGSQLISIGGDAFQSCIALRNITIPSSVTSINNYAFSNCYFTVDSFINNSSLDAEANNYWNATILDKFTEDGLVINNNEIIYCPLDATSVTIPSYVTSIDIGAFSGHTSLSSVTFEEGSQLTSIDNSAFSGCSSLQSIVIPEGVTSIYYGAFDDCSSLTSITIPSSVTSINYVFSGCIFKRSSFINNSSLDAEANNYWGAIVYDEITEDGLFINNNKIISCPLDATSVTIPSYVTSIGDSAFYNCSSLSSITIPSNVTSIGERAFQSCYSLTSITIPSNVTSIGERAFQSCYSLTSITIPNSVTSIGYYTFSGCISLTSITIPSSVTSIDIGAFDVCKSLSDITIPNSVTLIDKFAFSECTSLSSVTFEEGSQLISIGNEVFTSCKSLSEITIPNSVTSIGNNVFGGCTSLIEVIIPSGVTSIGNSMFYNCKSLQSIELPNTLISIGSSAFQYCYSLNDITIPSSVTSIGSGAFRYCQSLSEITIPSSVTSIGSNAFQNCCFIVDSFINNSSLTSSTNWGATIVDEVTEDGLIINNNEIIACKSGTTSVTIPSYVTLIQNGVFKWDSTLVSVNFEEDSQLTSIDNEAFRGCSSLQSIVIPEGVTSIGASAFQSCYSLSDITIPNSVTSIGQNAFYGCTSLSEITIPNGVTSIGASAFTYCYSLTSITIPNSVTSIGDYAFSGNILTNDSFINNSSLDAEANNYWGAIVYDEITEDGLIINNNEIINIESCSLKSFIEIPSYVTSIGNYVFYDTYQLISVTFEEDSQLTSIGDYAFSGCSSLQSIVIPEGVTSIGDSAFNYCYSLHSIELPNTLTSIGDYAFSGCIFKRSSFINNSSLDAEANNYWDATIVDEVTEDGLIINNNEIIACKSGTTSVTIPSYVTSIGDSAFYGCSLTSITIPNSVTSIGDYAFSSCHLLSEITIPSSVTTIGSHAFSYCDLLTSFTFDEGSQLTSIGDSAFYNCDSLSDIIIPNSVTSIGDSTFSYCDSLSSVTFEEGSQLTSINFEVFYYCQSLSSIIIPNSVTSIGGSAFYYCNSLSEVTIPSSVTTIDSSAFYYCNSLTNITIPSGVTSLGNYTFRECTSLSEITFEEGSQLTSIGASAFTNCQSLSSITIPNSVTSIGSYAFTACKSLHSINIPEGVTSIGNYAFSNCSNLTYIYSNPILSPTISTSTFYYIKQNGTLYIPYGSNYGSWMSTNQYYLGYYKWKTEMLYTPQECTNLVITAENVTGRKTATTITYTATTNGINHDGSQSIGVIITGTAVSAPFEQNTSYTDEVERTITFEYMGVTASTTITQGVWVDEEYSIDLNNQWRLSTTIANPDSSLYDGVYESFSNKGVHYSAAICTITIEGYENFKLYVRSYAESTYDYVVVSNLDCTLSSGTTSGTNVKATTSNKQNNGTDITNHTLVEFDGIDGGTHTIQVMYRKDSGGDVGDDRGYLLIPKNQ